MSQVNRSKHHPLRSEHGSLALTEVYYKPSEGAQRGKKAMKPNIQNGRSSPLSVSLLYRVILSVLDPRKCEYLEDYSLDFEPAYMTTYLAS